MGVLVVPLLAVIFTVGLGFLAAWKGDFDEQDNKKLAKLTMKYALPLSIFVGVWSTPKSELTHYGPLAFWLSATIVVSYLIFYVVYRFAFKQKGPGAALYTLTVSNASVPFIGSALLPFLFNASISAVIIGLVALAENLTTVPATIALIDKEQTAGRKVLHTLENPLVFSPFLAFFLALTGVPIPPHTEVIFQILGKAASGIALFSIGITLFTKHMHVGRLVATTVFFRNLLVPTVLLLIMLSLSLPKELIRMVVLTMAIPTAAIPVTLAIRYHIQESEIASVQLTSTVISFFTLSLFIYFLGI
ncbi:AEC family transporter [Leuconostocaceae bacterium ESL0723]|nr:AEC family transporter [Lactobacillaceae bacterium L1_55_11]WEV54787.1 AEC family transporter [Leuconostocaceae bacterium ESL0723]